jgi:argininosuccinate lyase
MSKETISRERLEAPPGTIYAETILEPSHLFMLEHYFSPLASTNKAWTVMLVETGIVDEDRGAALIDAILDLEAAGPEAIGDFVPRYEYFYSHVEWFLTERIGEEIAGEINIARTRPEPLTRLLLRSRLLDLCDALDGFCGNLLTLGEREADTVMPQWTHFQPAQISTLGHYLVGIENLLARDFDRLRAAYRTTNRCTLGCGALAGTSYPIDRQLVSDLLGFDGFQENTIDCVAAADYVLETATATAGLMVSLSRLCQDLWIWHTEEFGFIEIGDDYAGSSSMMPQKKNAYVFEFVRARAAHAIGDAVAALGTLRAANFQDLKDVEEEVVTPVVRSLDEAARALRLLDGSIRSMQINRELMLEHASRSFATATELAAAIHRRGGLSYRTAHRVVANLVLRASRLRRDARTVDLALLNESARDLLGHELEIDEDTFRKALDPVAFVAAHAVTGGPAPDAVRESVASARATLDERKRAVEDDRAALADAAAELAARVARLRERVAAE